MVPVAAPVLLFLTAVLPAPPAQEPLPDGVVAAWDGGSVGQDEFERFLGSTFRNQALGRQGLEHLLQIRLVELEAGRRGLEVPAQAVDDRLAEARRQIEKAGEDLGAILESRHMTLDEFRGLLRDSILHEMLVRQDLERNPEETVTAEELRAWTRERVQELLAKSREAPPGFALQAPPFVVTEAELGRALLGALGAARLRDYLADLVLHRHLQAWARTRGIALTDDILQEELDWQAERAAESGADLGLLLQAAGTSLEEVKRNVPLRTTSLLRLMARERFDDTWFETLAPARRTELEERFGERRLVAWILLHAVAKGQERGPLDLSFEEAEEELRGRLPDLQGEEAFQTAATRYSEDEVSRLRKGVLGWIHRREPRTDPALCAAAFAAPVGKTTGPVRLRDGVALLRVLEVRAPESEEAFRSSVRRGLHPELRATLIREIHLRTRWDPEG